MVRWLLLNFLLPQGNAPLAPWDTLQVRSYEGRKTSYSSAPVSFFFWYHFNFSSSFLKGPRNPSGQASQVSVALLDPSTLIWTPALSRRPGLSQEVGTWVWELKCICLNQPTLGEGKKNADWVVLLPVFIADLGWNPKFSWKNCITVV